MADAAADREQRRAIVEGLSREVDYSDAKFRPVGGGKVAAYLPSEEIIGRANGVLGNFNWSCEVKKLEVDYAVQTNSSKW